MTLALIAQAAGVVGLVGIIIGVVTKREDIQDWFFIIGGLALLGYSAWQRDLVFIILQIVFIAVAAGELIGIERARRRSWWRRLRR